MIKNINKVMFFFIEYWIQYTIIVSLIILVSFLFPKGKSLQYAYQLNDIAHEEIIAPFTFPILKSEQKLLLSSFHNQLPLQRH